MKLETVNEIKKYIKQIFPELKERHFDYLYEYIIGIPYTDRQDSFIMIRIYYYKLQIGEGFYYNYKIKIGEGFKIEANRLLPAEGSWINTPSYSNDSDLSKIKGLIINMKTQYMNFKIRQKKQEIEKDFKRC
jgi:hypothetical protein